MSNRALSPAQRIPLIRKIAKLLSVSEWSDIDLILSQFDFPTSQWEGFDKAGYVISMIERGDDRTLIDLQKFLLGDDSFGQFSTTSLTKSIEKCWASGTAKLFISHSYKQRADVMALKKILIRFNISSFVAHDDIEVAEEWENEILCGLETCDAVVAWVTSDFKESYWAQQEIGFAKAKDKLIIPVRRSLDPFGFIQKIQGIKGHSSRNISNITVDVVSVLMSKPKTSPIVQESILNSLKISKNIAEVNYKIGLLNKFENWDEEMIEILKDFREHKIIKKSPTEQDMINSLLEKYSSKDIEEVNIDDLPF